MFLNPLRRSRARFPLLSPTVTSSPGAGEVFPLRESQAVTFVAKVLGAIRNLPAAAKKFPLRGSWHRTAMTERVRSQLLPVKMQCRSVRRRSGIALLKIIFPLQRRRPPPAAETGRSCWGSGQQDASAAQGTKRMLGAATRRQGLLALDNPKEEVEAQKS